MASPLSTEAKAALIKPVNGSVAATLMTTGAKPVVTDDAFVM